MGVCSFCSSWTSFYNSRTVSRAQQLFLKQRIGHVESQPINEEAWTFFRSFFEHLSVWESFNVSQVYEFRSFIFSPFIEANVHIAIAFIIIFFHRFFILSRIHSFPSSHIVPFISISILHSIHSKPDQFIQSNIHHPSVIFFFFFEFFIEFHRCIPARRAFHRHAGQATFLPHIFVIESAVAERPSQFPAGNPSRDSVSLSSIEWWTSFSRHDRVVRTKSMRLREANRSE